MIHLEATALRATVQDRGRFGHIRDGVPPSGPADPAAFAAAQALVGNDAEAAAIEIVGDAFAFRCDDRRLIAVTGRDVALHSGRTYRAFFLGFLPGFAYCGVLDPRIVAPRLVRPRERVPAGSVAIADGQTSVYPFDSPGGWRLIGRTDARVFDSTREPPALIRPGDRVRFVAS